MKELAPTGKLRAGIVYAPAPSAFFAIKDEDGRPRGVTVDLASELAQQLGVTPEFLVVPNSGLVADALESGAVDVAFMPVDDERKKRVDFGPNYCLIESTYMVTGASGIKTLAEVDRPKVRVVGIANTTTIRAAARALKNTKIKAATSVEEAVEALRTGNFPPLSHNYRAPGSSMVVPADRHRHRRGERPTERIGVCRWISRARQGVRQRPARPRPGGVPR